MSAGFHLAVFLAPWNPMPKTRTFWVPKPELEIFFPAPNHNEDDSMRTSSPTQLATSQEKPEPLSTFQENLEPSIVKRYKPASPQYFSKPKANRHQKEKSKRP